MVGVLSDVPSFIEVAAAGSKVVSLLPTVNEAVPAATIPPVANEISFVFTRKTAPANQAAPQVFVLVSA